MIHANIEEWYNTLMAALAVYPDAYVSFDKIGDCMICQKEHDLRCGVCFGCCDKVEGKPLPRGHKLWEIDSPSNYWFVGK